MVSIHDDEHSHGFMGENSAAQLFPQSARTLSGFAGFPFLAGSLRLALAMGIHIPDVYADHVVSSKSSRSDMGLQATASHVSLRRNIAIELSVS